MANDTRFSVLIAYPARGIPLLAVSALAIVLSVAFGGVLAQVLGGQWATAASFAYLLLLAVSLFGLQRSFMRLLRSMKPVLEFNDEEIIDFRSDTRIAWANIVEFEQRRSGRQNAMRIRYLDEEVPEIEHVFDLPLGGLTASSVRLANQIRARFARVDGDEPDEA